MYRKNADSGLLKQCTLIAKSWNIQLLLPDIESIMNKSRTVLHPCRSFSNSEILYVRAGFMSTHFLSTTVCLPIQPARV